MSECEITFAIIGCGGRGRGFAEMLKLPEFRSRVVAIAEPDDKKRQYIAELWNIPASSCFRYAEELFQGPKIADAVINTTQDQMHKETALSALARGYHMLLEKPMAVTLEDCREITEAAEKSGLLVMICHSLRYHAVYNQLKKIIDSGRLGEIVSFDHIEGVGNIHQSFSYVRGAWGNESRSTFMLMAKCCHDFDLFQYLFSCQCRYVSSFGKLSYFNSGHAPTGAPKYCLAGCPAEVECPYHVCKIYVYPPWRNAFANYTDEEMLEKLRTDPRGKCVFRCDNDVVDHQVAALEYEDGMTGTFTMTAFHPGGRFTRIHGTNGYAEAAMYGEKNLKIVDFITGAKEEITVPLREGDGHGGGDFLVMHDLIHMLRKGIAPALSRTGVRNSLESHLLVFAAELSRREKRMVEVKELELD